VTVRWVQFADGTTFGDNSYARPLFEDRTAILKALQQLHEVYLNEGLEKFIEQLQQPVKQPVVDGYLEHIRTLQKQGGAARAVEALETHLNVGQQRADLNASAH
jgi:predicted exporter